MKLGDFRRGLLVTQSDVAVKTGLAQSLVAWLEEQPVCDLDVTTLAVYLRGLGGRLEAVIPAPHGAERKVAL